MSKLIIYGDIHGCYNELIALRNKINPQKNDIEVCVGDIITKGQDSIKTLRYVKERNIKSVIGNHEERILRYLKHQQNSKNNPIKLNQDEKDIVNNLNSDDIEYLKSLPLFIKTNNMLIIHAGLQNTMDLYNLNKREKQKVIRLRYLDTKGHFVEFGKETDDSIFWSNVYDGNQGFVIYGHQPFLKPRANQYSLGIDTGCVYGNKLSAAIFDLNKSGVSYQIISVPAKKIYYTSQTIF